MRGILSFQFSVFSFQFKTWSILLAVVLLLMVPRVLAQSMSPTEAMLAANQNYEAGQFEQAIAGYERIIEAGIRNSDVYYNLGNAYFKQGDLGRAILNYRRAQRLDPRDADIAANLTVARAQTIDQLEVSNEGTLTNLIQIAEEWLTLNEAAILALILWLLISIFAILAIFLPRWRRAWSVGIVVVALFLVIGLISMANRLYKERQYPPAVIVAVEIDATSGPGGADQYLVEFNLHTGAEVRLLESRPDWRRITLPGDLQGWVPREAVELVVDR